MGQHDENQYTMTEFVGRKSELDRLLGSLRLLKDNPEGKSFPRIFLIHGEGGVGKSELIRYFEHEGSSAENYALFINVDCGEDETRPLSDPQSLMRAIFEEAKRLDCESCFSEFAKYLRKFNDLHDKVWHGQMEERNKPKWVVETASRMASQALTFSQAITPAVEAFIDAGARGIYDVRKGLAGRFLTKEDERNFYINADSILAEKLATAISTLGAERRLVLLIDQYERLASYDSWFRQDFIDKITTDLLVVIAGRNGFVANYPWKSSKRNWFALDNPKAIETMELSAFDLEDTKAYISKRGVPQSDDVLKKIYSLTRGLPLAVQLMADALLQSPSRSLSGFESDYPITDQATYSEIIARAVTQLLKSAPKDQWPELYPLAIIRHRDDELLAYMLGDTYAPNLVEKLSQKFSFIRLSSSPLHPILRDFVRAYLQSQNSAAFRNLSRKAADYYGEKMRPYRK